MSQNLISERSNRLAVLQEICVNGRAIFYMVGIALDEIKRDELFKEKGFSDFHSYCESIGYSRRHCDRLIIGANFVKQLPENLQKLVHDEKSARALRNVPASLRLIVAMKVSANTTRPITAAAVRKVAPAPPPRKLDPGGPNRVQTRLNPPPRSAEGGSKSLDKTGLEIPIEVIETWKRRDEVSALLGLISSLRAALKAAQSKNDKLFAEVDFTDDLAKLNQLYEDIGTAMPYAVCPECNGKIDIEHCGVCKGRGLISEFYWRVKVPKEIKDMTGRK